MKRWIAVVCFLVMLCGCAGAKEPKQRDWEIYDAFLRDGGLYQIREYIIEDFMEDKPEIETCLIDINDDQVYELLLKLYPLGGHVANETYLLGIKQGQVEVLYKQEHGGGTAGGSLLHIKYDTQEKRHVVAAVGNYNRGAHEVMTGYFRVLGFDGQQATVSQDYCMKWVDMESDYTEEIQLAEKARQETDLYLQEDTFVGYCQVNGQYVTQADFRGYEDRYIDPTDENYQLKDTPIENYLKHAE